MATCPRCGGRLERYELWGREQHSCPECGYVGVPVEHKSRREPPESWGEAIRRYQETGAETAPKSSRVDGVVEVPRAESSGSYLEPEIRREEDDRADPTGEDPDARAREGEEVEPAEESDGTEEEIAEGDDGAVTAEDGEDGSDATAPDADSDVVEEPDDEPTPASDGGESTAGRDESRRSALLRRKKKR